MSYDLREGKEKNVVYNRFAKHIQNAKSGGGAEGCEMI
jgi:hypothetical protein